MSINRLAFVFLFIVALSEMALAQSVQSQLDLVAPAETLMRQGNYNSALDELDKIIKVHPRHNLAYFIRGSVKLYIGDLEGAMTDTETAIRLAPKVFGVEKAYNNRGAIHQMRGEIDKALADFDKAIALNSNYSQPYNGRGVILEKKGRIDEALAAFEKAVELDPKGPAAYVGRGDIRFQRNEFEGAIYDINKLLDLDPGNSSAYIRRGIIRGLQNRWEFGVADIRKGFRTFNDPKLTNR